MSSLEGRVAIVTGAGRGIGAAVAWYLAHEGAAVMVNDTGVNLDGTGGQFGPAREVVDEITSDGGRALASTDDIVDHGAAARLIESAIERFGKLDILVNAAGILRDRMVFNMTPDEWEAVIAVHLTGTFNTTKHAAVHWRERRDESAQRRLINFTSKSGIYGAPGQPNYAAAKMGVIGFTYSCANALGRYGVTANAVSPGAVTRMTQTIPEERRKTPMQGDVFAPESVARVVAWLAGASSEWLTGRVVEIRGHAITLYSDPEPVRQVVSAGPWDDAQLSKTLETVFRPAVTPRIFSPKQAMPAADTS